MSTRVNKILPVVFLVILIITAYGCGSKVVVGRSVQDYKSFTEEPAVQEEKARPEQDVKPVVKAEQAPAVKTVETPVEPPEEVDRPAAPPEERAPTVTPQSSRREALPEDGSSPFQLDLSFGGFGLSQGLFDTPVAVSVDEDENIYVLDQGNFRVQKFDRFGLFVYAWGRQGLGDGEFAVEESDGTDNLRMTGIFEFSKPVGMMLDTDEARGLIRLTVTDSLNHRIQRFLLTRFENDTFPDEVFVMLPEGGTVVPDDELKARYAQERIPVILDPVYIDSDKADSLFLSPYIWGGLGFAQGLLNMPAYLAKDDSGILWVSDTGNGRVQGFYVAPDDPLTDTNFFREFGNSLDSDFGEGRLNEPTALVFDNTGYGSFLVLDTRRDGGFVMQRFDRQGEFLGVVAESGGKPGQLRQPVSMAVSPFDNTVFITDRGHRKVMVYNNDGEFLFAFGGEELADPRGITVLRNNFVYVTDAAKNMVYRYIPR